MYPSLSGPYFHLGVLVQTAAVSDRLPAREVAHALARHMAKDWGDLCEEDKRANDNALRYGDRLFSVYHSSKNEKFYVITEWDRSVTTILFPEEY